MEDYLLDRVAGDSWQRNSRKWFNRLENYYAEGCGVISKCAKDST